MFNEVRKVRKSKKISMLELSRRARISPADLSLIENLKRNVYPGWKRRISEALEVEEQNLFPEVSQSDRK